jgi:hypothetical protein
MDYFFNILRKSLVLTLLLVFGFVFTYVPQYFNRVNVVEAFPVEETGPALAKSIITAAKTTAIAASSAATAGTSAVSAGVATSLLAKEFTLDGIGFAIAKSILSSMIGSLIQWINSGFEGKPAFIQDVRRFLIEAADRAAGEYIDSLGGIGSFICSPFQLDIQIALALEYQQARDPDNPQDECRISGIVDNLQDFYEGSFNESSLQDLISITSNPNEYTPYGQLLTARTAMRVRLANEQGEVLTEADWGGGFLSGKICEMVEGSGGPKESCSISKPGQVIAGSLNKALGAGQDQLVAADEINELIAALISQLANQAITGSAGLLGLSAGTGYTSPGFSGGSYLNAATSQANGLSTGGANLTISSDTFSSAKIIQQNTVSAANSAIPALLSYKNNTSNPQEKRTQAQAAYNDAVATRDKALGDIPRIDSLQNEFNALQTQLSAAGSSAPTDRTREINLRLTSIEASFNNLNTITKAQLTDKIRTWVPPTP